MKIKKFMNLLKNINKIIILDIKRFYDFQYNQEKIKNIYELILKQSIDFNVKLLKNLSGGYIYFINLENKYD